MTESSTHRRLVRRYYTQFALAMMAYVAVLAVVLPWLSANPDSGWRIPMALLPIIPLLSGALVAGRFVQRMDERFRSIQLRALAFAFIASAVALVTYGFLEEAGVPRPSAWWVWSGMGMIWFVSSLFTRWRYR